MDFDFSSEQFQFQESMRGFLSEQFDLTKVWALLDGDGFNPALWSKLAELGVFAMLVPEDYDGLSLGYVDLALIIEEFGRALVPPPVGETLVATDVLARFATDAQKARLLPKIAEGALKIVPAIFETEGDPMSDGVTVTAERSGNGWTVSGRKILVPHAAIADFLLIGVRFGADGPSGLVLLEPGRSGITLRQQHVLDLTGRYHEVTLDHVGFGAEDVIGGDPSPASLERLLEAGAAMAAGQMIGIAGKVLDDSVAYAAQRVQFGKPIGSFQAIKHRCADIATAIDTCKAAAYYAAWALAEGPDEVIRAVSLAKSSCGDTARFACNEAIQIHGGMGFTWELGLHFYLRRTKVLESLYGDVLFHRERLLTETLAGLETAD